VATHARRLHTFRLFVAGTGRNSVEARHNLTELCEKHLKGRYRIDIVDVFRSTTAALAHHVLITPTLIRVEPRPGVTIVGNLSDTRLVVAALQLNGHAR
jgi:circadian clock protein KaiB